VTGGERAALRDLLERPPLRRLWGLARARLERYGAVRGSVRLDDPDAAERRAVADLLGLRSLPAAARPLRVTLAKLDRTLRRSRFGIGLERALELHGGALRDLPAERAAEEDGWRRFWQATRRHPVIVARPELAAWLDDVDGSGLYRRLSGKGAEDSEELMRRILAVLAELVDRDGGGGVRLAVLASRVLGDSHALDAGHRVPALVLRALARLHDRPLPATAAEAPTGLPSHTMRSQRTDPSRASRLRSLKVWRRSAPTEAGCTKGSPSRTWGMAFAPGTTSPSMAVVRKRRFPHTTGEDSPRPGRAVFQRTFFVGLHSRGIPAPSAIPWPWAPRHAGQRSSAAEPPPASSDAPNAATPSAVRAASSIGRAFLKQASGTVDG